MGIGTIYSKIKNTVHSAEQTSIPKVPNIKNTETASKAEMKRKRKPQDAS